MKVRVNSTYRYNPVGFDLFAPTSTNNLKSGDLVKVINLPGCPPANTCGQAFVRLAGDSSKAFVMMVSTSSLEKQ
jgi:hypothetical protein